MPHFSHDTCMYIYTCTVQKRLVAKDILIIMFYYYYYVLNTINCNIINGTYCSEFPVQYNSDNSDTYLEI